MSDASYWYACRCGVQAEFSPRNGVPSTCPRCGELVGISVISEETFPVGDSRAAPEFIFSQHQLTSQWPRGFWYRVAGRMARKEVVVASQTAGEILLRVAKPEPAPPGRKPGPLLITDEEAFRQTVRQAVDRLKQTLSRINVTTVAEKCGWARGTLYRYAKGFQIDIKAFIRELTGSHEERR